MQKTESSLHWVINCNAQSSA